MKIKEKKKKKIPFVCRMASKKAPFFIAFWRKWVTLLPKQDNSTMQIVCDEMISTCEAIKTNILKKSNE